MREGPVLPLSLIVLAIGVALAPKPARAGAPSFTVSASNATMPTSGAGSIPFTLTSVNGFAGSVAVSCGPANPPPDSYLPQCGYTGGAVATPPYNLTANGTLTESLSLVAYIPPCSNSCPVKLPLRPARWRARSLVLAGALLLGLGFRRRAARWFTLTLIAFGSLAGLAGIGACGGGKTLTPGTYAYTVSATQVDTSTSSGPTETTTVNVMVPAGISTNLGSANP